MCEQLKDPRLDALKDCACVLARIVATCDRGHIRLLDVDTNQSLDDAARAAIARLGAPTSSPYDALAKCEAVLSQLQDAPEQAPDIVRQGYFGHALVRARKALSERLA